MIQVLKMKAVEAEKGIWMEQIRTKVAVDTWKEDRTIVALLVARPVGQNSSAELGPS